MINTFVAAFVAIFFWGKSTKEVEEKTRRASKLKTFAYFVLSVVVGMFFYKTYQVSTIYNVIQVNAIRASYDSNGNIVDSIPKIEIFNRFSSGGYSNDIYHQSLKELEDYNQFAEVSGIRLTIYGNNKVKYWKRNNPDLPDEALDILGVPIKDPSHVYAVGFLMTSIPQLIPLYPKGEMETGWEKYHDCLFMKMKIENLKDNDNFYWTPDKRKSKWYEDSEDKKNIMVDGFGMEEFFATRDIEGDESYTRIEAASRTNLSNTFNFFTAADISQYSHMISINSDCHIGKLVVDYDVPIETISPDTCLFVGSHGFEVKGEMLEAMKSQSMIYHVKLPTMANLQLIRSLILTTLITALLSLFFRNLYYLMRKWAIKYKKGHTLPYAKAKLISRKRVKWFKRIMYIIIISLLLLILWLSYLMFTNSSIYIPIDSLNIFIAFIIGAPLVLILIIYLLYRYMRKPCVKESDDNNEDFQSIFVHERDEDSEYDQLVEEMYKDNPEEVQIDEGMNDDEENGMT